MSNGQWLMCMKYIVLFINVVHYTYNKFVYILYNNNIYLIIHLFEINIYLDSCDY